MSDTYEELQTIAADLEQLAEQGRQPEVLGQINRLRRAADEVGKSSSGSWLGYHANVYYKDLKPPPPEAHFSRRWGFKSMLVASGTTTGNWAERDPEEVIRIIYERAGNPDLSLAFEFTESAQVAIARQKSNLFSIIEIESATSDSQYLREQREAIAKLSLTSELDHILRWQPKQPSSQDTKAIEQGTQAPPHVRVRARVDSIRTTIDVIASLAEITRQVAAHTSRQRRQPIPGSPSGTRVFIGHGHSQEWRALKDFLEDRLGLPVDEFNRVSSAGIPTTGRLSAMLDSAAIALLVMTGEDEQSDGQFRARENVVHEAGLFQGRLGFERAIILLEDGCQEFSNIVGLGQIRFPKGNIEARFEEIRRVLEREGVLKQVTTP